MVDVEDAEFESMGPKRRSEVEDEEAATCFLFSIVLTIGAFSVRQRTKLLPKPDGYLLTAHTHIHKKQKKRKEKKPKTKQNRELDKIFQSDKQTYR